MSDETKSEQYSLLDGFPTQELAPIKYKREPKNNQHAKTAMEVWDQSAIEAKTLAFVSRILVQAFLPHSDPKDIGWSRRNGDFTLDVKSGIGKDKKGKFFQYGVPYGTVPRLLLAWLNTQAVSNSNDESNPNPRLISLGRSLSEFLDELEIGNTGGKNGGITRFKKQMEKLFHAEISVTCTGKNFIAEKDIKISDGRFIFWDVNQPKQMNLWESSIELSEAFYKLLINTPVPMDWRILKNFKQSPMALDLYMWLTHRMCYVDKPVAIKWETLAQQLGSDVQDIHKFRQQVRKHLRAITVIWKDLRIDASKSDAFHLYESKSMVTPKALLPKPFLPKKKFSKTWQTIPSK
jgi:hypothetical protein